MGTSGEPAVEISTPRDGDVLNRHDGEESEEGLTIEVVGKAPPDQEVTLAGQTARREGDSFYASVTLTEQESLITAQCPAGADQIQVLYDRNSHKRFRFSVDDNVLFLRDLTHEPPESLFDHWFLAFWREMHEPTSRGPRTISAKNRPSTCWAATPGRTPTPASSLSPAMRSSTATRSRTCLRSSTSRRRARIPAS